MLEMFLKDPIDKAFFKGFKLCDKNFDLAFKILNKQKKSIVLLGISTMISGVLLLITTQELTDIRKRLAKLEDSGEDIEQGE